MKQKSLPELSKTEFSLLNVLWKKSPLSVREIHDRLDNGWAYTTTKTTLDRMVAKGILGRESAHGVYIYSPCIGRAAGLVQWVRFIADNVFDLEPLEVVNLFAKRKTYSDEELRELRELLSRDDDSSR
ncbi:BlaI/MecI/CopY family transcriptional regulator [Gilvimarinus algae]|uniref:BlaI/MecI/CopY family transcriptional regulator n=1 Tax=Gilvimarinus algae TaxID=3058037 RepID=A0ABT8TDG3_9GAMM|nr:BlaI/MecI/CopY family transcriptional regulator [Gilvimarinus sp. SDUM040014]MDO3381163.1 BlaI/MecI/CopY family transcriptional regulator [Gilvimarinus sp. SDUM040014]